MLVGRDRERQALERLLAAARGGRSGVLALVGEPGIGKSALLDEAEEAAVGMRVLRARGVQSEAQIPFAGLFELLRPALGSLGRVPEPQAEALETALALRPGRAEARFAVGAATLSLLAAEAEREPLAVLVDDAHWLDGSSADALLFAVRRLVADPIAVVLSVREGESSLLDGADLPTLRVEGLEADAAALLLRREVPAATDDTAVRLHRETGGNPLALLELAREEPPQVPFDVPVPVVTSVAAAYVQRAEALPAATRDALALAAATDRGDLGLLARAGGSLGVGVADLAPAEAAALVSVREGRVEFRHPLTRSAIYGAAAPERRRDIHRALAGALPDADRDRRAWHLALAAAGPDDAASSALEQAGGRAYERSAYDVAARAFERAARLAVEDDRRGRLLSRAADAAWLGGLGDRATELLAEAARFASDGYRLELEHLRGHIGLRRGPLPEARRVLLSASERADPALGAVLLAEAVFGAFFAADVAGALECGERARALVEREPDARTSFFGLIAHGIASVLAGGGEDGAASIRAALEALDRAGELRDDPRLLAWAALGPLWLREADLDRAVIDRALATARARSAIGTLPSLLANVAIEWATTDRWAEAQAAFDEAIRLAAETDQRVVVACALARLAWLEARLGREEACREHAGEALERAPALGATLFEIWALGALVDLELGLGRPDAALARVEELEQMIERHGIADPDLWPAPERVELQLRLGRRSEAEAIAGEFGRLAEAKGQPWALARAARCGALLAEENELDACFDEALALHAQTPDVFETARTELAYGARLRRAGRRGDARERLRAALARFEDLAAAPWAELARAELGATGETARRREPSTIDELTPQELQVSLLLAEGRTTREAAAALFLSPKTIEYHLRNAYRKLAIHSREELAQALGTRAGGDA